MAHMEATRSVIHADLDAFYASVEQLDRPELRGKPVLVGGNPEQRGVVAACSYEARVYGVHSAMLMRTAVSMCPGAIVVHPRFDRYGELSRRVMDILRSVTPLVQPVSIDEAYLDISGAVSGGAEPIVIAQGLKERVKRELGLTISLGVASSKSVAKIASDMGKPDGLTVVPPGAEREFLAPLSVRKLGGIGPKTEERLLEVGVKTLGDLAARTDAWLEREFGKRGPELGMLSRGMDDRAVSVQRVAKSISAEVTLAHDVRDRETLAGVIERLCERVGKRLERAATHGRTVTVKLRLSDFTTFTRSVTLPAPIHDASVVREVAMRVLDAELARRGDRFRLLGVGVSNFAEERQLPLFGDEMDAG